MSDKSCSDITVLIHTFKRPEALKRLTDSIKLYYPTIKTIIYDDSDYDRGISWGRNYLVKQAKTDYVFICDDDSVFTDRTKLEVLRKQLIDNDADMVSVKTANLNYSGTFDVVGDVCYLRESEDEKDFTINSFIAKRESLLKFKWDERLKIGEHFAYFFEHRGKMKILHNSECNIDHIHVNNDEFDFSRRRAWGYLYMYMREQGITKRIGIDDSVINVPYFPPIFRNDDIAVDSNLEQIKEIHNILKEYGIKEYFSVVPYGKVEVLKHADIPKMTNEQINELTGFEPISNNKELVNFLREAVKDGCGIILHGHNHSRGLTNTLTDKKFLDNLLGCDIKHYAFPFNHITAEDRAACPLEILDEIGDQLEKCVREDVTMNQPFCWYHYWRFYEGDLTPQKLEDYLCKPL